MKQTYLFVDMETRSHVDLPSVGTYRYTQDPTTDIICAAFVLKRIDHDAHAAWTINTFTWRNPDLFPGHEPIPEWLVRALAANTFPIVAHHAEFEMGMWEFVGEPRYDFPEVNYDRWVCSAATARANALPGSLDKAAFASGSQQRKDYRGAQLIKLLSIPRPDGTFCNDLPLLNEMVEYCEQDVNVMIETFARCYPLSPRFQSDFVRTVDINDRGVRIDRDFARLASSYATIEAEEIAQRLREITNGYITKHTQTRRIAAWVYARVSIRAGRLMLRTNSKGVERHSVDKSVRADLLDPSIAGNLPTDVREVLQLTDDANRSSVAKYQRMLSMANPDDDRVRGAYLFAGAGQTLRFSSKGLQMHNTRRDSLTSMEMGALIAHMSTGQRIDQPMDTLSRALRNAIIPGDGNVFVSADWSAMEAMTLPYLSGSRDGQVRMAAYADPDTDVYLNTAAAVGLMNTPDPRQAGKVVELSMGFGGGEGALRAMARNFKISLAGIDTAYVVQEWRVHNQWAVNFWKSLEIAAKSAINAPHSLHKVRPHIAYSFDPALLGGTLICHGPLDMRLQYPFARIEEVDTPYGPRSQITALKASRVPASDATEWPRATLWHGLLAENVTQAVCAAILRAALSRLDREDDYDFSGPGVVIGHTHDDILMETRQDCATATVRRLEAAMTTPFPGLSGLNLQACAEVKTRYGY